MLLNIFGRKKVRKNSIIKKYKSFVTIYDTVLNCGVSMIFFSFSMKDIYSARIC